jgi:hypothetical protein
VSKVKKKLFLAISHVNWLKSTDVLGADMVPETLVIFNQLTWLIACEEFITSLNFSLRLNFIKFNIKRSYILTM